ncbi:hypothetical protein JCM8547_001235 [Rhodosporidiobolus lusitaniae]
MRTAFLVSSFALLAASTSAQHHPAHHGGAGHVREKKWIWATAVLQDGQGEGMPGPGTNADMLHSSTVIMSTPHNMPTSPSFPPRPDSTTSSSTTPAPTTTPAVVESASSSSSSSEKGIFTPSIPRVGVASAGSPAESSASHSSSSSSSAAASVAPSQTTPAAIHWYLAPLHPITSSSSSTTPSPTTPASIELPTTSYRAARIPFAVQREMYLSSLAAAASALAQVDEAEMSERDREREKRWVWGGSVIQDDPSSPGPTTPPAISNGHTTPSTGGFTPPSFPGEPGHPPPGGFPGGFPGLPGYSLTTTTASPTTTPIASQTPVLVSDGNSGIGGASGSGIDLSLDEVTEPVTDLLNNLLGGLLGLKKREEEGEGEAAEVEKRNVKEDEVQVVKERRRSVELPGDGRKMAKRFRKRGEAASRRTE